MDHLEFFRALHRSGQLGQRADLIPYAIQGAGRGWLVNHPALVQQVMVSQERRFDHPPHPFPETAPLLTNIGALMLRLGPSRLAHEPENAETLNVALAAVIADKSEALTDRLRRCSAAERRATIGRELERVALESLCSLLFGVDVEAGESLAFIEASATLERWRLDPASVDADALERAGRSCERLADRVRQAGEEVSVGAIMATIFNGYGAFSTTLAWALALLVHHPNALAELELEVLATRAEPLATLALDRLPFARAVVRESLRLYPPAWLLQRRALASQPLGSQPIEPDDTLSICLYTLHRDPRFWDQADDFRPERFMTDARGERPKHSYLPFGAGRRVCPAEQIGVGMVVRVLVGLVREFSIITGVGELPRPLGLIALCPDPELALELQPK